MRKTWVIGGLILGIVLLGSLAILYFASSPQTTSFTCQLSHGIGEEISLVPLTLSEQIQESQVIVRGRVTKILGTVETSDISNPGGTRVLHNNVVIEVEEYLGETVLPYDKIVIRLRGGRVGFYHHIVNPQEHFTVGEEIILFRLYQPSGLVQVPKGFVGEQYFVFAPGSKLLSGPTGYTGSMYANQTFSLATIRQLVEEIQGE